MFDLRRLEFMATSKQAMAALNAYGDSLTRLQNVVGIGIVAVCDDRPEEQAVGVYVERKVPIEELDLAEVVPSVLVLEPDSLKLKIPTRVIEQGRISKKKL